MNGFLTFITTLFLGVLVLISLLSFIIGSIISNAESRYETNYCEPESYAGKINLAWRAGCELGVKRWRGGE